MESCISPILAQTLPATIVPGLYVHVPFCSHKCHYCDFYSITRQSSQRMQRYVELILAEADQWASGLRGPMLRPSTVFFGGGTPSLLPIEAMRRLLLGLRERFDFSGLAEWTVECNPATVSSEYSRSGVVSPSRMPSCFSTSRRIRSAPRTWQAVPRQTRTIFRPLGVKRNCA